MLSFKFKRLCSQVVASLSALGLFSFSDGADAAVVEAGGTFSLSVPRVVSFSADYAESCPERFGASVRKEGTGCVYTCKDNFAVDINVIGKLRCLAGPDCTGYVSVPTGVASFTSSRGVGYLLTEFAIAAGDVPDDVCAAYLLGSGVATGDGLVNGVAYERITGTVTDDITPEAVYAGMKYLAYAATGICEAGYTDQPGVTVSAGKGVDGEYNVELYASADSTGLGFASNAALSCYPISYNLTFDCGVGTTKAYDAASSSGIQCSEFGAQSCTVPFEYRKSEQINIMCSRDGYKFNGWTYSTDE